MRAVTLGLSAILSILSSPPTLRPVTIDDLMRMRAMSDVRISPDGERVAYVVSEASFERNAYEPVIFVVPSAGGPPVELTPSTRIFNRPLPAARLKWTPDGSALSFLAWVGERPQVMTLPLGGRAAKQVTSAPEGVSNYEWAPDGRAIAYVSAEPMSADEAQRRKDQTFVIQVDRQNRPPRLWLATVDGAPPRALTPPEHFVDGLTWAPDGRSLVYSAAPFSGFMAPYETSLYSISREGGTPRVLVERDGIDNAPQFSPDGRHVAFISTGGRKLLKAARGLSVISLSGDSVSTPRMLTGDTGTWVAEFTWAPDSKSVLFTYTEGTFAMGERMFESPPARVSIDSARIEPLTTGPSASFSPSISRDGRRFAYRSVEHGTTGDVHVLDLIAPANKSRRITEINSQVRELALGKVEPIRWKSFDGMEIWGLLVTPSGYDGKQKLPTLVYSHGGPIGGFFYGIFPQFPHTVGQVEPYPVQAMASAGFAILLPMPRGGSGYGEKGFDLIVNSWGEGDYRDIMAGVDYLIARGIADPNRLGAMGASYGGFMTSWIVGQTARFKAASTGASVTDLASMYYISEGGDFMAEYFKAPWENPAGYAAHSPLTYAAKVTTPLLIQHGEVDPRVPVSQARALYRALKAHGKLVELDIYPRGGHVLYEPKMQREQMRRNLEWFTRWLK